MNNNLWNGPILQIHFTKR